MNIQDREYTLRGRIDHFHQRIKSARERVKELRANYNSLGPNWEKDIREICNLEQNIECWKQVLRNLESSKPSHGEPVRSFNSRELLTQ